MERFTAFTVHLSNIERSLHKIKSKKMAEYGLRATHLMCMIHIYRTEDGLTPTEISRTCAIDKAFVSRITYDLTERDLITFNERFSDGRKYKQKYILTDKGVAIIEEIKLLVDKVIGNIYDCVSVEELKCFYKVLDAINANINASADEI